MSLSPQKLREIIIQFLFSFDMGGEEQKELIPILMNEVKVPRLALSQAFSRAEVIWKNKNEIDQKIRFACNAYDLTRIGHVERNILRLALFEYCIEHTLPLEIIISEAIRLTKKFSSKEGGQFVHAIIDTVSKAHPSLSS